MGKSNLTIGNFFRVMISGGAYLNLVYLLAAFPLGIFYFTFLVSGLSLGISLSIIWVGIPILLLVDAAWWVLARFERYMAIQLLKEEIPAMARSSNEGVNIWIHFKTYFTNPVTWKGLLYLFMKFPLGIVTFVVLTTVVSLTLAFLTVPFTYQSLHYFQGISFGSGLPIWQTDSIGDALLAALIGLMLWPVTLHITNGLAWVHAKFARLMLSVDPFERRNAHPGIHL
jgi:hypothetical protein